MSDESTEIRVTLGPVARALIEGKKSKRPTELDRAITRLQDRAQEHQVASRGEPEKAEARPGDPIEIGAMRREIGEMHRAFVGMKEVALAEMRMTRLLVGTLVDQSNEDYAALLRFVGDTIRKIYETSELLTKEDLQDLDRKEDLFQRLNRIEVDRTVEPERTDQKSEDKSEGIVR